MTTDLAFSFVKRFKFEYCSIYNTEISLEKEKQGYRHVIKH
jgi:hypothetical protein